MLIEERNESIAQGGTAEKTTEVLHFEKLAPINNANIEIYEDAINFVFENPDPAYSSSSGLRVSISSNV